MSPHTGTPGPVVTVTSAGGPADARPDLLAAEDAAPPLPLPVKLLSAAALAVLVAGVSAVDPVRKAGREAQARHAAEVVAVDFGVAEVRQGVTGDFFASLRVENAGADVEIVESAFRSEGLELLEPIGGVVPVAAGTTASLSLHLVPDCDATDWSGTVALVVATATGREHAVEHVLPAELLAEGAEEACARQG